MSDWSVNEYGQLSRADMENNAGIIYGLLSFYGWTAQAISALLGNMEAESGINPGRWQSDIVGNLSGGYGLVQWTPATKLFNWIDSEYEQGILSNNTYSDGDNQIARIRYEVDNHIQYHPTKAYPESFKEFTESTKSPGYLAVAFLKNYERPKDSGPQTQSKRIAMAERWYTFITGLPPGKYTPPILIVLLSQGGYGK